jgi:hypothetical protein
VHNFWFKKNIVIYSNNPWITGREYLYQLVISRERMRECQLTALRGAGPRNSLWALVPLFGCCDQASRFVGVCYRLFHVDVYEFTELRWAFFWLCDSWRIHARSVYRQNHTEVIGYGIYTTLVISCRSRVIVIYFYSHNSKINTSHCSLFCDLFLYSEYSDIQWNTGM